MITVKTTVDASPETTWALYTNPVHVRQWNNASEDWITPIAENDLRKGGKLKYRMEAKDGSTGFDFEGTFDKVEPFEALDYTIADGRHVMVRFQPSGKYTTVQVSFEAESVHSRELQEQGWQAILVNFRRFVSYTNEFKPIQFAIKIQSPKQHVWTQMTAPDTYREWAGAAWPGSYFEGKWIEGSTISFFDKNRSGTKSILVLHRPFDVSIAEHVACYDNGAEVADSDQARSWVGSKECYYFKEQMAKLYWIW